MGEIAPLVFVVDDDKTLRDSLGSLFRSVGMEVETFPSPSAFLERGPVNADCCLVLDVRLPGLSGLDFQTQLADLGNNIPIVFMTGHGDVPMSVRAMKAGAFDFLIKPFRDQDMLDAVTNAIAAGRERRASATLLATLTGRYDRLTSREREVMTLVSSGLMNKQIAGKLGLSEVTVKIHRGHVMGKMDAHSLADLVKMEQALRAGRRR
jgi:FixJ family two-component response regulator